jgi:hypothetical protein
MENAQFTESVLKNDCELCEFYIMRIEYCLKLYISYFKGRGMAHA